MTFDFLDTDEAIVIGSDDVKRGVEDHLLHLLYESRAVNPSRTIERRFDGIPLMRRGRPDSTARLLLLGPTLLFASVPYDNSDFGNELTLEYAGIVLCLREEAGVWSVYKTLHYGHHSLWELDQLTKRHRQNDLAELVALALPPDPIS